MNSSAELPALVAAVRDAIDGAERDLSRLPFFVRPMVRLGFASRTGLSYDEWRERLDAPRTVAPLPAARAHWNALEAALQRLADDFRTAPARAAKGMTDPVMLAQVRERCEARAIAVGALLAWIRSGG